MTLRLLTIERISRLGRLGELLAAECLEASGFTGIKNLNDLTRNFPFADIIAERGGNRYLIGVKARNEFRDNGRLNPCYNAVLINKAKNDQLKREGKSEGDITALLWAEVGQLANRWEAIPAWVTVALRPEIGTYSAYFGLVSMLGIRRSIPMKPADRRQYECLVEHRHDQRIKRDLSNRAYPRPDVPASDAAGDIGHSDHFMVRAFP